MLPKNINISSPEYTIQRLINSGVFPQSQGNIDLISAEVWGVISEHPTTDNVIKAIQGHLRQTLQDNNFSRGNRNYNYDKNIKKKDTGQLLECFIVDILKREEHNKNTIDIFKGTPVLDHFEKVDFLMVDYPIKYGQINEATKRESIENFENITYGIQLTTSRKGAKERNNPGKPIPYSNKKREEIQNLSSQISRRDVLEYPGLGPHSIMMYFVINGSVNNYINKHKFTTFEQSLESWKLSGFPYGGPSNFLDPIIQEEFKIISKYFFEIHNLMKNFLNKSSKNKRYNNDVIAYNYEEDLYIIESFNNKKNELSYILRKKEGESDNFLFEISYFLNNDFIEKMGKFLGIKKVFNLPKR